MGEDKPLLTLTKKDFAVTYFSGSGAGGQHRNKHMNCVRITHPESGVTGCGTEQRSRQQNKRMAFKRLTDNPKFMAWLKVQSLHAEDLERAMEDAMKPANLSVEVYKEGQWKSKSQ